MKIDENNIKNLEERVTKAHNQIIKKQDKSIDKSNPAIKILSELISGVAVGAILGYFLDKYFNTSPFLLIFGILLGFSGGMLNIYRDIIK
jgi:F0F1-type ATP synthase assembly protein I